MFKLQKPPKLFSGLIPNSIANLLFDNSNIDDMRDKVISEAQKVFNNRQWNDLFKIKIYRHLAGQPIKEFATPFAITGFTYRQKQFTLKTTHIGTAHTTTFDSVETDSLSLEFEEDISDEVYKFIYYKDDNTPILPQNGTYLLPYDWYFTMSIEIYNEQFKKRILKFDSDKEFILEGGIERNFKANGGEIENYALTFKPILS